MKLPFSPSDLVVHPLLFAAFPVLYLYQRNITNVPAGDLVIPLLLTLSATIVVFAIAALTLRNVARAGLVTTIGVFVVLAYGHVYPAVKDQSIGGHIWGRHLFMIPLWCLLGAVVAFFAVRAGRRLNDTTRVLNIVSAVLLATVLVPIAVEAFDGPAEAAVEASEDAVAPYKFKVSAATKKPDIYYIVFEDYAGHDSLKKNFHYDDTRFLNALRKRGLFVANSWTNYPRTTHSMAASLNMQYLDRVAAEAGPSCSWGTLFSLLKGHRLARTLKGIGYTYVDIASWWKPTANDPLADIDLTPKSTSEFARTLYQTTLPAALGQTSVPALDWGKQYWRLTRTELERLEKTRSLKGPKFVFAHIMLPHDPWVFQADGSFLSKGVSVGQTAQQNYMGQHLYTNKRILEVLDKLLAGPKATRPVIVLQSDEGTHPKVAVEEGDTFRWDKATAETLQVNLNILNAYYWPGLKKTGLYPSITPVNSFRLLLGRYFGAKLPLLPDRVYGWEGGPRPCALHDVTKRVDHLRKPTARPR